MILILLLYLNLLYQTCTFLLLFTKYIGFFLLIVIIVFVIPLTCIILPSVILSSTKRFQSLLANTINLIASISCIDTKLL